MNGWMDWSGSIPPALAAPPKSPLGSGWSSGSHRPRDRCPARPFRYYLLMARACYGASSQSNPGTPPPGRRNHLTKTCHPSHSPSHGSRPLALIAALANTRSDRIPSVSAREGLAQEGNLECRAVSTADLKYIFCLTNCTPTIWAASWQN